MQHSFLYKSSFYKSNLPMDKIRVFLIKYMYISEYSNKGEAFNMNDDYDYDEDYEEGFDEGYEEGYRSGRKSASRGGGGRGSSSQGCYIATAVYGSYDCPEVWTLRRFRDCSLKKSVLGRMFIKVYYALSPTLVQWFGNISWLKKLIRYPLNGLVNHLKGSGLKDTPYKDTEN